MKNILVDAINTFIIKGEEFDRAMYELLEKFPNRKIIVTNATPERMKESDFQNLPYEIFTLENNPPKTDPAFFRELLSRYNLGASDVIYFEHNPDAVKTAESLGIIAYHFDADTCDLGVLEEFLRTSLS